MHPSDAPSRDPDKQLFDEGIVEEVGSRIISVVPALRSPAGGVDGLGKASGAAHELHERPRPGGGCSTSTKGARRRALGARAASSLADGGAAIAPWARVKTLSGMVSQIARATSARRPAPAWR